MSAKLALCSAVLATLLLGGSQVAAQSLSKKGPHWTHKPTGEDMAHFYPGRGQDAATPGRAIIDCDVTPKGLLDHCRVVEEWPVHHGFGDAALNLSRIFWMDPKTLDTSDPSQNRVVMPIVYNFPGKPKPPNGYLAGQNAVALSVDVKPGTKYARECPTQDKPDQLCVVHALEWEESPRLLDTLPALEGIDMETGTTVLQCRVSTQSRLTDCVAEGNPTPAAQKAMLTVVDMLIAPEKAMDGAPVGEGPVVVPFDWSKITPLARTLKRPY